MTAGCGEGGEPVSLDAEGLEYVQRIDQPGMRVTAQGELVAITDLDYFDCVGTACVRDRTSVFRQVEERWRATNDVPESDWGEAHILATNGETILLGRLSGILARVRFFEQRGGEWQTVLEIEERGIYAAAFDGDRAVLARANTGNEPGVEVPVGSIHLYERRDGSWVEVASASTADTTDLGWSSFGENGVIAMHGHVVAVADPATRKVHLFDRIALRTREVTVFEAPFSDGSFFGSALAVHGDRLAVGASGWPGSVFVYTRESREVWTPTAFIQASNSNELRLGDQLQVERFGEAVALEGDLLIVGAPGETSSAVGVNRPVLASDDSPFRRTSTGALYVFERLDDRVADGPRRGFVWRERYYIKVPGLRGSFNELGRAVAIDGDRIWAGDNDSLHLWRLVD